MSATAEIFVVTGPGQGHRHPRMELCLHLTHRSYLATLVIPSHLSSPIPPSFASNPLVAVARLPAPPALPCTSPTRSTSPPAGISRPTWRNGRPVASRRAWCARSWISRWGGPGKCSGSSTSR
ncbi:hypothetical protein NL676_009763 [Syzygium grande]|nr:hypothetical protein NL676_009763 [Syzygium grande]